MITDHCTSCGRPFSDHLGIVGTCKDLQDCRSMLMDCWSQFCIDVTIDGEQWQSDGALSTLEDIADYLHKHGMLTMHKTRPVYRPTAPAPASADSVSADTHREPQSNGK